MAEQQEAEDGALFYPFCVDTWASSSLSARRRRHFFLTHAHLDHTRGIAPSFAPIFCSPLTARLLVLRHPQMDKSMFSIIDIEEPRLIHSDDGSFTVTAYDANHCPGAVMFLFEGVFGTVLHTGDCRLTPECCTRLPRRLFGGLVDCLFLDCTFGKDAVKMPTREEAINQVKQCIWNHPDAPIVYLACDLLGQELLLRSLCFAFGFKIFVDKHNLTDFHASLMEVAPELITDNPKLTRLHVKYVIHVNYAMSNVFSKHDHIHVWYLWQVCEGFPKLYEKAKNKFAAAYAKGEHEPLFIRASAQWYTYGERLEGVGSGLLLLEKIYEKAPSITQRRAKSLPTDAERDPFGIWHVCYSMHSSQDELELFVSKLKPRQVISTTPHCKATELSYVRTLKISAAHERAVSRIISMPLKVVEKSKNAIEDNKNGPITEYKDTAELPVSSPIRHLPLFGMAVAGLLPSPPLSFASSEDCSLESLEEDTAGCPPSEEDAPLTSIRIESLMEKCSSPSRDVQPTQSPVQADKVIKACNVDEIIEEKIEQKFEAWGSPKSWKFDREENYVHSSTPMVDHTTKNCRLGETARRIYRSLNMMIPRPLPSLLELDREIKRGRF